MILTKIFVKIDDFYKDFEKNYKKVLLQENQKKRNKKSKLYESEIMTIIVYFHICKFRTFKDYYLSYVLKSLKKYFPNVVSYNRFVELMQKVLIPLTAFLKLNLGTKTGIYFIDSTPIEVCHIKREKQNKVFKGIAKKSKTTKGWFFGLKLHLIINQYGEIISFYFTKANVCDNNIDIVQKLTKNLKGVLIGDKGYISKNLFENLFSQGLKLVTKIKKNMKNLPMYIDEKFLLKKRGIIESVIDILKNHLCLEHTRHRSITNAFVNMISALIAYNFLTNKPKIV